MPTKNPSLADLRRGLHVSYSQIRTYTLCSERYAHVSVRGTEPSHRVPSRSCSAAPSTSRWRRSTGTS